MIDASTCDELEDIAQWFALRGQHATASFLRAVKDHLTTCKECLPVAEVDALWQQNVWNARGLLRCDYRLFAREIERAHGIGEARK